MKLKVVLNEKEEIDLSRIDGLSSLSQSTSDNSSPQYGIIANTGSIELIDTDGKFEDMINNGELPPSSVSADIYIDDKLVQKHITTDSTYDKNGNELQISLSNSVELLNNMVFSGINYEGTPLTAYDILFRVFSEYYGSDFTEDKFKELMSENIVYGLEDELYGPIYSYLKNITLEYPYIETGKTYKEIIDDFCAMTQLQMYVDTDGYIKATSARPVIGDWDFIIANEKCQMSDIKEDLFVKNKYNGIEIPENKFSISEEQASTVATINEDITSISSTPVSSTIKTDYDFKILKEVLLVEPISYFTYIHSECSYYTYSGSATFSKKQKNNLENIISVYDPDVENLPYSLTYKSGRSSATANIELETHYSKLTYPTKIVIGSKSNESVSPVNYEKIYRTGKIDNDEFTFTFTDTSTGKVFTTSTPSTFPKNVERIKLTDNGDTFTVDYTVVCKKIQTTYRGLKSSSDLKSYGTKHISTDSAYDYYFNLSAKTNGFREEQYATALEINISGDKYTITFDEETIKTSPESGNVNVISYPSSVFITDRTKYNGVKISSLITNKLLKDYADGVRTATFTTTLNGLSTLDGYNGKVRYNGNYLIELADIVYPKKQSDGNLSWRDSNGVHKNKDISVYKTTGFNLVYDGEILNELELIKVKYCAPVFSFDYDSLRDVYSVRSNPEHSNKTSLSIPETYDDGINGVKNIENIDFEAFKDFNKLDFIDIPAGIKWIGSSSFSGCSSLKEIILPVGLERIDYKAFANCSSITQFEIPSSVEYIQDHTFYGCDPNTVIYCSMFSEPETFGDWWNVYDDYGNRLETHFVSPLTFEDDNGTWKVTGLTDNSVKHLTIPDRYNGIAVTSIADNAFANNNTLRTVKIGNNITKIGDYAFGTCRSLYQVTLGTNVSSIGTDAFRYCDKLVSVINNSSLSFSAGSTNYGYIGYYMINNSSIEKIGDFVFVEHSSNLTLISYDGNDANITLPTQNNWDGYYYDIAYNISKFAFYHCKFETVTIGSNINSFGETVFYNCANLKNVYFADDTVITSLPTGTFYGCSSLESLAIPNSVISVGSSAFDGCSSMRKVYIPSSVKTMDASQSYLAMFRGCSSTLKIYCGASSKQSGWGTYWNYYNASSQLSVTYNTTRAQYDAK